MIVLISTVVEERFVIIMYDRTSDCVDQQLSKTAIH